MLLWITNLRAALASQSERWFLWLPVIFACGIGVYFLLPAEPSMWLTLAVIESLILLGVVWRHDPGRLFVLMLMGVFTLGFASIQLKAIYLDKSMPSRYAEKIYLIGQIESLDINSRGNQRVILKHVKDFEEIGGFGRVKVSLRAQPHDLKPGQCLEMVARIMPLPAPSLPGGYQYDRKSFFEGLSGSGYALTSALPIDCAADADPVGSFKFRLETLRRQIVSRIYDVLPPEEASITAAVLAGVRGGMSQTLIQNYRDSGLAHFLSISGLHMSMIAGLMFFFIRLLISLVPPLALRYDSKKISAIFAILISIFYLLISGAEIPTQRAFIMTFIVLLGVLFGRRAISMKTISWAALIVLIISPQALIGASFQMSFAAVICLIAFYERYAGSLHRFLNGNGVASLSLPVRLIKVCWVYLLGIVISDLVASLATLPFSIYHFNRVAVFTSLANLLAGPVIGFVIMPFVLLSLLLMPLGLEYWTLKLVGFGVGLVNDITDYVSHLPNAGYQVLSMPLWGLLLVVFGILWLCIWTAPWRRWGLLVAMTGMLSIAAVHVPDLIVNDRGNLFAVRDTNNQMVILPARGNNFNKKVWLEKTASEKLSPQRQNLLRRIYQGKTTDLQWLDLTCQKEYCLYAGRFKIFKSGGLEVDGKKINLQAGRGAVFYIEDDKVKEISVRSSVGHRLWNMRGEEE